MENVMSTKLICVFATICCLKLMESVIFIRYNMSNLYDWFELLDF